MKSLFSPAAALLALALSVPAGAQQAPAPPASVAPSSSALLNELLGNPAVLAAPRFPSSEDWKAYGGALDSVALGDLDVLARGFAGEADPGKDRLSYEGVCLAEALALQMNPADKANTRRVVFEWVSQSLRFPSEDAQAGHKSLVSFFEARGVLASAATPLSALLKYKSLLANKGAAGPAAPPTVPVTDSAARFLASLARGDAQQRDVRDFFSRARTQAKAEAAVLSGKSAKAQDDKP